MSGEDDADAEAPTGRERDPAQARKLLARAREVGRVARSRRQRAGRVSPEEQTWSGPAADRRDPALLGASLDALADEQRWAATLRSAGLLARWPDIVGAEIAAHCRPERLVDGELVCVAESTAWATQLRLLSHQVLDRLAGEIGPGVVARLRVYGLIVLDWWYGPLRVRGRGPRDTYG